MVCWKTCHQSQFGHPGAHEAQVKLRLVRVVELLLGAWRTGGVSRASLLSLGALSHTEIFFLPLILTTPRQSQGNLSDFKTKLS